MSNFYPKALKKFAEADIDWTADDIKVCLIDTNDYTYSDSHEFHSSLAGIIATSGNLSGKSVADGGILDANNVTFTAISGDEFEAVVIFKDTGVSATSPLIAYLDSATGLPLTPNGANITLTWSDGTNKIGKL